MFIQSSELNLSVPYIHLKDLEILTEKQNQFFIGRGLNKDEPFSVTLNKPLIIASNEYDKRVSLLRILLYQFATRGMHVNCYNETMETRRCYENTSSIYFNGDNFVPLLKLLDIRLDNVNSGGSQLPAVFVVMEDIDRLITDTMVKPVEFLMTYSRLLNIFPIFTTGSLDGMSSKCMYLVDSQVTKQNMFNVDYIEGSMTVPLDAYYVEYNRILEVLS